MKADNAKLERLLRRKEMIEKEIAELESRIEKQARESGKEVLEIESTKEEGSYVLQKVRCGKPTCKCARSGELHGPYWYLYARKDGREVCKYIGKQKL
ncbi:MAG TPA: hypothetical protein PK918_01335 [Methanotrichaceae archaeon]|nr:hypothetical protein [Methanotrichaceae archaeon]